MTTLLKKMNVNIKLIEILMNLILDQNRQLLQIIAQEEELNFRDIMKILPSQYEISKSLSQFYSNHSTS